MIKVYDEVKPEMNFKYLLKKCVFSSVLSIVLLVSLLHMNRVLCVFLC